MVSQCQTKKSYGPETKTCQKPNTGKFDLKVKVQGGIWILNVRNKSSHGDHPCAKYGKPMSKKKIVIGQTQICTDGQTEGQTIIPHFFVHGGYNNLYNLVS